jgi:hypothetical protein
MSRWLFDEAGHRLFVGSRSGAISVFDPGTGKELTSLPIGGGVDDMVLDSGSKRPYATCGGDGLIYVYQRRDAETLRTCGQGAVGAERPERSAQQAAWALLRDCASPGVDPRARFTCSRCKANRNRQTVDSKLALITSRIDARSGRITVRGNLSRFPRSGEGELISGRASTGFMNMEYCRRRWCFSLIFAAGFRAKHRHIR